MRAHARQLLRKVGLSEAVARKWEQALHRAGKEHYRANLYEALGLIRQNPEIPITVGDPWSSFEEYAQKEWQQQDLLQNPFEVEEGVIECHHCHSKKTLSRQVQMRSGDEGMTTLVQCTQCQRKWRL